MTYGNILEDIHIAQSSALGSRRIAGPRPNATSVSSKGEPYGEWNDYGRLLDY